MSILYRFFFVTICVFVIKKYWSGTNIILKKSIAVIIFYWTLYLLKAIFETLFGFESNETGILDFWIFAFLLCFLPMFPLLTFFSLNTLNLAKKILFGLAIFVNVFALNNNLKLASSDILTRFNANDILNPITYGQTGLILVIISFSYFLNTKSRFKFVFILLMCAGIINIGLAASRGPVILLFLTLGFYIFSNFKKQTFVKFITVFIIIYFVGNYFKDYIFIFDSLIQRIEGTNGDELRTTLLNDSWITFIKNPVLGGSAIGEYAHNIFFASIEVLGFLGGILILFIYKNAIRDCYVLIKNKSTDWISLLVIMQLGAALMSGAIWNGFLFWPLLALISNLYYHRHLYSQNIDN